MVSTVLVTGSAGFVGRHMCTALTARGWDVTGLDIATHPGQDIRYALPAMSARYGLIVHCAATVGGRAVIDGSPLAVATNLELDSAAFNFAVRTGSRRVVYFSSSAAYPVALQTRGKKLRLSEDRVRLDMDTPYPSLPDASYGWVKLTGERLARWAASEGVATTILRPFSGYGADQDDCYPFPAFAARARARADPFDVWGDPTSARDWIHIDDVVAATLTLTDLGVTEPVNLCTGRPTTFGGLAAMFQAAAGYTAPVRAVGDAPQGVHWRVGNPTRMQTHYTPKVTLEEGVRRALASR